MVLVFSMICAAIFMLTSENVMREFFVLLPEWQFDQPSWYLRLFSHTIGHSSMEHLLGNLSLVLLLGPIVEVRYGSKKVLIMIFATALVTSILHLLFFNHGLLGASGIVFMLIILVSMGNFKNKTIPLSFILIVLIYLGHEILASFEEDNISHFAHIIGGISGAIFGFVLTGKQPVNPS